MIIVALFWPDDNAGIAKVMYASWLWGNTPGVSCLVTIWARWLHDVSFMYPYQEQLFRGHTKAIMK